MHILILSWRDTKNPLSGGAEYFLHELAKRLTNKGHKVTLFTSNFPGGKKFEVLNGVQTHRQGDKWTVHLKAYRWYKRQTPKTIDLIIDNFHALPFFTPFYAKVPIISLIHEITRKLWFAESSFPINILGFLTEPLFFLPYRKTHFLVASNSTKDDLIKLNHPANNITVFFQGIDFKPLKKLPKKTVFPQLLCLSRISHTKRLEHAIEAMKFINNKIPSAKLIIAGTGKSNYISKLQLKIKKLKLEKHVKLIGHVTGKDKQNILKQSWLILGTSIREGWGLAITEAAAFATPAVTYNIPGFKNSVKNNKTGILVTDQKPEKLAQAAILLIKNHKLRHRLALNCLKSVKDRTREHTAKQLLPLFIQIASYKKSSREKKLNILITSWRDIKNPAAGGAEILTQEVSKRLVRRGHKLTILAPIFPGAQNMEQVDGVTILRPSYFFATRPITYLNWPRFLINAAATYRGQLAKQVDVVIDEVHGLPSFTPLYVNKPVILFPHEVANDIWLTEIPFPGNILGWLIERLYLTLFKKFPYITVSPSTASDLRKYGIKRISIIVPGFNRPPTKLPKKEKFPTFICLGRITKMKRLQDSISAFKSIKAYHPKAKLHIVGKGSHTTELKDLIKELKISQSVTFHGFVSEKKKYQLLSKSWALLSTSLREGWGLNVNEAASVGTPTIAYTIPGIIDTVIDDKTGLLTQTNNPPSLAQLMIKLIDNNKLRYRLSTQAKINAKQFNWNKTAKQFLAAINKTLKSKS